MNIYDQIKNLTSSEIREYVKLNSESLDLFNEISENGEIFFPFLLQHKALNDSILIEFINDPEFLLNNLIDFNYAPSILVLEKLITNLNSDFDEKFLKFLNAFPSVPIKAEHLFLVLNQELLKCSEFILLKNPSYFEPRVLKNFISLQTVNEDIISKIMEDEDLSDLLLKSLISESSNQNNQIKLFQVICNKHLAQLCEFGESSRYSGSDNWTSILLRQNLTLDQWENLSSSIFANYSNKKRELIYSEDLENSFSLLKFKTITFSNEVPKGSKFRLKYLIQNPESMDRDELLENISNDHCHENILFHALFLPLETIKKVNIEAFNKLMPSELRDSLLTNDPNLEKTKYLLSVLNSKFTKYLREKLSTEEANEIKGKKKSYFTEILMAIDSGNFEDFASSLQYGYSLDQFSRDSFQKSKSEGASLVSTKHHFLAKMTKEDVLTLADSNIKFGSFYDDNIKSIFNFELNKEELETLMKKVSLEYLYPIAQKKEDLVLISNKSRDDSSEILSSVFDKNQKEILNNPKILSVFIKNKKQKLKVSVDTFVDLSKKFKREDLLSNFELSDSFEISSTLNLKDSESSFLYELSDLINILQDNQDFIENTSFLEEFKTRDKSFYEQYLIAYLDGNKKMTVLLGFPVKIRRSKIDLFESLLENINVSNDSLLENLYSENKDFYSFKPKILKFVPELEVINFCKGKAFSIHSDDDSNLSDILEKYDIEINLESLKISNEFEIVNIQDKKINIQSLDISKIEPEFDLNLLVKISQMFGNPKITGADFDTKILLIKLSIDFEDKESFCKDIYNSFLDDPSRFKIEDVPTYESLGLIFDQRILEEILESNNENQDIINWVYHRTGDLSFYFADGTCFYDMESLKLIKNYGANILSDSEFQVHKLIKKMKESGIEESINISDLSLKQKSELILFIENDIDPNYKKLNLLKENLEELDEILPFGEMVTLALYSSEDLIGLFFISPEIHKNPKLIPALQQLLAIKGLKILSKVKLLSDLISVKGFNSDMALSDFIDYSDVKNLKFNDNFLAWKSNDLDKLSKLDLKFDSKKSLVRFLNSLADHGDSYLSDIEGMINRILVELENLKYRLANNLQSEDEKKDLDSSIKGIESRLIHIKGLDRASDVHDRLITLSSFIKEDPLQLIGQDKFKDLETSQITDEFGYKLFFPKNRAEVQELGNTHGWCVSANSGYADNVISKRNILVAVSPKASSGSIDEVMALAHFTHNGNNSYTLEQFKWSAKIKGRQADAKNNFNYKHLIQIIETHLAKKGNKE